MSWFFRKRAQTPEAKLFVIKARIKAIEETLKGAKEIPAFMVDQLIELRFQRNLLEEITKK